jgi:hypothetical protein
LGRGQPRLDHGDRQHRQCRARRVGELGRGRYGHWAHRQQRLVRHEADGTINTALWQDFSERSLHELALKTKALTAAYYQKPQKFAYWEGCSTGGRQGYKIIQNHPTDYDGYVVGAPAFNWTKFITAELYPQVVYQRDLGGVPLTTAQYQQVSAKAVSACDVVGGQHLGFVLNPQQCAYDPAKDAAALCTGSVGTNGVTGTNATAACVTTVQATAMNKIWFGQTPDGSVPDPAANNGYNANHHRRPALVWPRRAAPRSRGLAGEPRRSRIASPTWSRWSCRTPRIAHSGVHAMRRVQRRRTAGADLTYGQLADAFAQGVALQPFFGHINTDNADLSAAKSERAPRSSSTTASPTR